MDEIRQLRHILNEIENQVDLIRKWDSNGYYKHLSDDEIITKILYEKIEELKK